MIDDHNGATKMPVFSFDYVIQIEDIESNSMGPAEEVYGHIEYYDERIDDLMILGTMHYSKLLLPEENRGLATDYEVSMSWFDSPQNVSQLISEERSIVELRADFMGIMSKNSESAEFVFREPDSTNYESRRGAMGIHPDRLPEEKSMDFLDWSTEWENKKGTWGGNSEADHRWWPIADPYASYYVTFEFENSSGALDNPPRKRND